MAILVANEEGISERIASPFYHGSPYSGAEHRGLDKGAYLTKDKEFAENFGENIYRIKLPVTFFLELGEDYDQYVAQQAIPAEWIKLIKVVQGY